jgi:predicted dehydrogenase
VQIATFRMGGLLPQAIASRQSENAKRVAETHGIPEVYADWRDLVASDQVDIVSITTPPHLHAEMAIAALQAGKHVICEKPTALNTAEAERMLAAAQAAPNQLAIIDHELRFTPQRQKIYRLFRSNFVGQAIWVEMSWRHSSRLRPDVSWNWWSDAERGGGALGAIGSHLLDLSRWLFGRVESINAHLATISSPRRDRQGVPRQVTADEHTHLDIRFANGLAGTITASAVSPGSQGMKLTLYGTHGVLRLDESDRLWAIEGEDFPNGHWQEIPVEDPVAERDDLPGNSSFVRGSVYLAQEVAQILNQEEPWLRQAASFYDGFKVQQMLDSARISAAEQRWVTL